MPARAEEVAEIRSRARARARARAARGWGRMIRVASLSLCLSRARLSLRSATGQRTTSNVRARRPDAALAGLRARSCRRRLAILGHFTV